MSTYDDNPLLFITSTNAQIPQGRNARAQHRSKAAGKAAPAKGEFSTLDFSTKKASHGARSAKRQKQDQSPSQDGKTVARERKAGHSELESCGHPMHASLRPLGQDWSLPSLNPTEILLVATFHIRRMAVLHMRTGPNPNNLPNILRCRQWSCIPYAGNCFGKDACVDSAIICVADRIRYLTGCPFSPLLMLKHYDKALREVQKALYEPEKHHPQDVLAAVQLLALYEMSGSLDGEGWERHVAGAEKMITMYTTITPEALAKWESRGCGHAMPMFGDALMKGDANFFRTYPWRELLWAISGKLKEQPPGIQELMLCLRLLPNLLLDVDAAMMLETGIDYELDFALLDRAHDIRHRMRSALCGNQLYTDCNYRDMLSTFDLFGTFLAGLVALDRMISALRPAQILLPEPEYDPTEELCAQLLQLELGASGHYPPAAVLAGFQHAGMLDTKLSEKASTSAA